MKMYCYYGSLKEKIPAHVKMIRKKIAAHVIIPRKCLIIPRKLKREDTGSYDNTAEVSKTTTNSHIMDHKDRIMNMK